MLTMLKEDANSSSNSSSGDHDIDEKFLDDNSCEELLDYNNLVENVNIWLEDIRDLLQDDIEEETKSNNGSEDNEM